LFISGLKKYLFDFYILFRFFISVIKRYGFIKGVSNILLYFKHKQNLFRDLPNRYIKKGSFIFVVPDVPPVNTKDFIKYLINDLALQLNKQKPTLLFSIICISSVCPYKCRYCYNISSHTKEQQLSFEVIIKTIEELIKLGVKNIYLSGGEPMMRFEVIIEILKKFSNQGIGFWLVTTGWGLDKEKAITLENLGLRGVMISLDDVVPYRINNIKGKAAFENAVKAIKAASETNLVVVADCVVHKDMLKVENFEAYISFAGSIGVDFINLYAPRIKEDMANEELRNLSVSELRQIGYLAKQNQTLSKYLQLPLAYSPDEFESRRGCLGGEVFFYIGPDGSVKACPFKEKVIGNVKNKNIADIINEYRSSNEKEYCAVNSLLVQEKWD